MQSIVKDTGERVGLFYQSRNLAPAMFRPYKSDQTTKKQLSWSYTIYPILMKFKILWAMSYFQSANTFPTDKTLHIDTLSLFPLQMLKREKNLLVTLVQVFTAKNYYATCVIKSSLFSPFSIVKNQS